MVSCHWNFQQLAIADCWREIQSKDGYDPGGDKCSFHLSTLLYMIDPWQWQLYLPTTSDQYQNCEQRLSHQLRTVALMYDDHVVFSGIPAWCALGLRYLVSSNPLVYIGNDPSTSQQEINLWWNGGGWIDNGIKTSTAASARPYLSPSACWSWRFVRLSLLIHWMMDGKALKSGVEPHCDSEILEIMHW